MAIQFPNFLGHGEQTPDYSPISNLLGNILRGYQIVKSPAQMERQAQSEELANALKQLQLQHAPTKMSLEEELLRAQIEKARKAYQYSPLQLAVLKEQHKADIKKILELEDMAKNLVTTARDVGGIQHLLAKKEDLTGIKAGAADFLGQAGAEMGEFNERATRLQAQLARMISQRGGEAAARIAAAGKPNKWKNHAYNVGITDSMQKNIEAEFNDLQKQYRELTGKDLPYTLEDAFYQATKRVAESHYDKHGVVHLIAPNGKDVWVPDHLVDQALNEGARYAD